MLPPSLVLLWPLWKLMPHCAALRFWVPPFLPAITLSLHSPSVPVQLCTEGWWAPKDQSCQPSFSLLPTHCTASLHHYLRIYLHYTTVVHHCPRPLTCSPITNSTHGRIKALWVIMHYRILLLSMNDVCLWLSLCYVKIHSVPYIHRIWHYSQYRTQYHTISTIARIIINLCPRKVVQYVECYHMSYLNFFKNAYCVCTIMLKSLLRVKVWFVLKVWYDTRL